MAINSDDKTATRLRAILAELEELLPPSPGRNVVLRHLWMTIARAEGGLVLECADCGQEFSLDAARVSAIRAARPRRQLPRHCSMCHGLHRHQRAERAQRWPD